MDGLTPEGTREDVPEDGKRVPDQYAREYWAWVDLEFERDMDDWGEFDGVESVGREEWS